MSVPRAAFDLEPHGISVIDTGFGRPRLAAAYLLVEQGRAAFVDTGTNHSVTNLLATLRAQGLQPADVDWLIVTHVHLDHAGGAGLLLAQLPNARLVVHPRGARHLADPSQLMAGVRSVYGDGMVARDYGELVPVSQERILAVEDGNVLHLADRPLRFLDTPGHARHHFCVWDERSGSCFAGDTLGVCYEELRAAGSHYALPSTSPVQFDPEALPRSIERLLALRPQRAYITHYGGIEAVRAQAMMVLAQVRAMVEIGRALGPDDTAGMKQAIGDLYWREARANGVGMPRPAFDGLVEGDLNLNVQGLVAWLRSTPA